jgi:hypothetical protein
MAPTVLALGPQLIARQIGVPDGGRGVRLLSTTGLSPPTPATRNARKQRSSPATAFAIWASPTVRVLWRHCDRPDPACASPGALSDSPKRGRPASVRRVRALDEMRLSDVELCGFRVVRGAGLTARRPDMTPGCAVGFRWAREASGLGANTS